MVSAPPSPLLLLPLLVVAADAARGPTTLPSFIRKCSIKDPNVEQCALESGREVLPRIVKGEPKIHLPSLDPLNVEEISIQTGNGPSQFDMHSRNIVLRGLADTNILSIGLDQKNMVYSATCQIPRLEILADYTVDGRVLLLPIKGSGRSNFTFENAMMYYEQKYSLEKREGRYYLMFPANIGTFNCSRAHFHLDNLFNGDQQLGNTINTFLNENWRAVVDDLGQPFVDAAAAVIRQFTLVIVGNVPFDEIFDDVVL